MAAVEGLASRQSDSVPTGMPHILCSRSIEWQLQSLRLIITVWPVRPVAESALQYIEIEYNQELKPLEAVLSDVKHPGDFFVCGKGTNPTCFDSDSVM